MRLRACLLTAAMTAATAVAASPGTRGLTPVGEDEPSPFGSFAFADTSGTRLMAVSPIARPHDVRLVITMSGRTYHVVHIGAQKAGTLGSGRDGSWNFANLDGEVYRIVGGRVGPDENCFLSTDSLLAMGRLVALERGKSSCRRGDRSAISKAKGRPVVDCWKLARFERDGRIILYRLKPDPPNHMAGIALIEHDQVRCINYPAKEQKDDTSLWREGDGGSLTPDEFDVLFLVLGRRGCFLGIAWHGSEGTFLELNGSLGNAAFTSVGNGYRYLSPQ